MRVAVTGATGILGRSVVPVLQASGHEVVALARTPQKADVLAAAGAEACLTSMFDSDGLTGFFTGCDAVVNLATHIPVGYSTRWPGSWRVHDRLRTEGVRRVVDAARAAGVRRLVQESVSFLYADQGSEWITESSPLEITRATEPASVGESYVQDYTCRSRVGVVLRMGNVIGDDGMTRWLLRAARGGRPVGLGSPDGWAHVLHTDDIGPVVLAALTAPSGVYNVGAEPVVRADLVQGYADAVGRDSAEFCGPMLARMAGPRVEPLTRSLRVSSAAFIANTGWLPTHAAFDRTWFEAAGPLPALA